MAIILIMKRYNLINNLLGWVCFVIAAATYLLTIEPTASFWDCPEFIAQGVKLEVGHPPGNPIFMLAARFFVNFAGGDLTLAAAMVNSMSALLSAGTILLLFWTITHLVKRLIVKDEENEVSLTKMLLIFGSGICGSLCYTWSDTFWFSAVEGEVYAFSSFCTALVVWLMLKWDARASNPSSDRYLILIAYVIGISIAVHLLNLLTIPALALIFYFRRWHETSFKGSLVALLVSFAIIIAILYGLVPGFIEIAQSFELFFVNTLGLPYNVGVLVYAILLVGMLIWSIAALRRQTSLWQIRVSLLLSVVLSGMLFIGSSWFIPVVLIAALVIYLWKARNLHFRLLSIVAVSILVIFVGYSSYALLLIRSTANPPMNQNAPDNVFALGSYLNREQYGDTPLFYGPQFTSEAEYQVYLDANGGLVQKAFTDEGKTRYTKLAGDSVGYKKLAPDKVYRYTPNVLFPRMYSTQPGHPQGYKDWVGVSEFENKVNAKPYYDKNGDVLKISYDVDGYPRFGSGREYEVEIPMPSFGQNMRYFLNYQLNHMYWRYFLWNFAGRQNDIQSQGEPNRGNWISGIPFIDNARLGDQSLLPDEYGKANKGHNVFYMLPLLMGLLGIFIQLVEGRRGVHQFWIVFLLFFMTGIAIVLYLNQPPMQPRERDYAFAGSFYAFAIWVGLGVYSIWQIVVMIMTSVKASAAKKSGATQIVKPGKRLSAADILPAAFACLVALFVPLQVVSQTWDDHDRSGRYTTRDYGLNYLNSLDENAIIFTNGDNDTFPLWYAQEVLGERTDVRVVNLAYLGTDWYVNQMRIPSYNGAGIAMQAVPEDYAYDRLQVSEINREPMDFAVEATDALTELYGQKPAPGSEYRKLNYPWMYIPVDIDKAVEAGVIRPEEAARAQDYIMVDLRSLPYATLSNIISLDMLNTSVLNGWNRPVYFAITVPDDYYLNLGDNLKSTGLAYQVTPYAPYNVSNSYGVDTDKMYENVTKRFRWGGLDNVKKGSSLYLDETIRRMVTTHRSALLDLANALFVEGYIAENYEPAEGEEDLADKRDPHERYEKAIEILDLMQEKLPYEVSPYSVQQGQDIANMYNTIADQLPDREDELRAKGRVILEREILRYLKFTPYLLELMRKHETSSPAYLPLSQLDMYAPHYAMDLLNSYHVDYGQEALEKFLSANGYELRNTLEQLVRLDVFARDDD